MSVGEDALTGQAGGHCEFKRAGHVHVQMAGPGVKHTSLLHQRVTSLVPLTLDQQLQQLGVLLHLLQG